MSEPVSCPSCGAHLRALFRGPEMVVCEHCRAIVVLTSGSPAAVGRSNVLLDRPSPFRIGMEIAALEASLVLVGRIRYAYPGGEWDEWTLRSASGLEARLADDEGDLTLFTSLVIGAPMTLPRARPQTTVHVAGLSVLVAEIGAASLVGIEGTLTKVVPVDSRFDYIDGHTEDGLVSIRAHADRTEVFRGRPFSSGGTTHGWD